MEQFLLSEQIPDKRTVNKAGKLWQCQLLGDFFDWHSHQPSCRGADSTDTTAHISLTTHTCVWVAHVIGIKKAEIGGRRLLTSAQGKAKKDRNLADSSPNRSHFYLLFFSQSLPSFSVYTMVLDEYLSLFLPEIK